MKIKYILLSCSVALHNFAFATSSNLQQLNFANEYAAAWFKTQMPNSNKADLEHYLSFLTEDVAYQHLPYDKTDERKQGGKQELRQGMSQWLASNEDYQVTLNSINFSNNIILLNYDSVTTLKSDKDGSLKKIKRHVIDSLELDKGKVSVIRKYW